MAEFFAVGRVEDFTPGRGRLVTVEGRQVAVFRLDEQFFAIDNLCLHELGPLCEGEVEGDVVVCPLHGWAYEIRTGTLVQDRRLGVTRHETRVVGDEVQVRVVAGL